METVELAKSLMSFETVTPPGNEAACARFIYDYLRDLHIESAELELQEFEPGRANLLARFGAGRPGLMLGGHSDVVPAGEVSAWRSPPFEGQVRSGRLYGRGAADMKSALAAMMTAVGSLKGATPKRDLTLVVTAGEEVGFDGLRALERAGRLREIHARCGVVGEPSGMRVIRAHRGSGNITVTFQGRSAHAGDPTLGINSIEMCMTFLEELRKLRTTLGRERDKDLGRTLVTPTVIAGGTKSNVIPGSCELTLDLRLIPSQAGRQVLAGVKRLLSEIGTRDKDFKARAALMYETPPLSIPRDAEVVRLCESLTGSPSTVASYGTEASVYAKNGIATVVLGPGSIEHIHVTDEYVELRELRQTEMVYSRLVEKLCL